MGQGRSRERDDDDDAMQKVRPEQGVPQTGGVQESEKELFDNLERIRARSLKSIEAIKRGSQPVQPEPVARCNDQMVGLGTPQESFPTQQRSKRIEKKCFTKHESEKASSVEASQHSSACKLKLEGAFSPGKYSQQDLLTPQHMKYSQVAGNGRESSANHKFHVYKGTSSWTGSENQRVRPKATQQRTPQTLPTALRGSLLSSSIRRRLHSSSLSMHQGARKLIHKKAEYSQLYKKQMEGQIKKRPIIRPRMGRRIVLTKLMAKRRAKRHDSNLPIHTTTTAGTSQNLPYLPPEILQHILSHLPLDAYFRAKSLGWSWVSHLSNPTSMKPHSIIVVQSGLSKAHSSYWKGLFGVEIGKSITELDYCFKFGGYPGELRHIIGACNGFLCIRIWRPFPVDDENYLIYNPVTRECLSLPQPPIELFGRLVMYGFGGTRSGAYKVALFTVEDTIVLSIGAIGWRREKRWERVPLAGEWDGSCKDGVCFEGSLHWIGRECVIVFELEVEGFLQFSFPPQVDNRYIATVGVLDKYLSLVVASEFDIKLYTMNQYGRDDSWELRRVVENQPYKLQTKVLKYGDMGQLIILHDDQFGIIASGENQIVSVKITKRTKEGNITSVKTAFVFLPTLLSLTDAGFLIHPQDRT